VADSSLGNEISKTSGVDEADSAGRDKSRTTINARKGRGMRSPGSICKIVEAEDYSLRRPRIWATAKTASEHETGSAKKERGVLMRHLPGPFSKISLS